MPPPPEEAGLESVPPGPLARQRARSQCLSGPGPARVSGAGTGNQRVADNRCLMREKEMRVQTRQVVVDDFNPIEVCKEQECAIRAL